MGKYIVNHTVSDFETVDIDDSRLCNSSNTVVLVLDESTSTSLHKYYNRVIDITVSGAKLICISVGKESKIRKTIMMAMASYRNYNIYKVDSIDTVTDEYIKMVINREPDLMEIQQYVGGDISAYSEINTILFGINQLINSGDLDGLKGFLENHLDSLESSMEVIEYLKRIADTTNSGELTNIIESLKNKLDSLNKENDNIKQELKSYRGENDKLSDTVTTLRRDVTVANRKVSELQNQLESSNDSPVITSYSEVNTTMIRCRAQTVIYFKEISYARYTNSLILNMVNLLKNIHHKDIKLLIYDSKVGMPGLYKGISILNTAEYLGNRSKILRDTVKYVVAEPNQTFIEDVLTSINPQFQVVIVYDRMKQMTNIVAGNNVTKIYVVNSASNLAAVKDSLRITPGNLIISSEPFVEGGIVIPEIPDYSQSSDSAKLAKYIKACTISREANKEPSKEPIISTILNKARVDIRPGGGA